MTAIRPNTIWRQRNAPHHTVLIYDLSVWDERPTVNFLNLTLGIKRAEYEDAFPFTFEYVRDVPDLFTEVAKTHGQRNSPL